MAGRTPGKSACASGRHRTLGRNPQTGQAEPDSSGRSNAPRATDFRGRGVAQYAVHEGAGPDQEATFCRSVPDSPMRRPGRERAPARRRGQRRADARRRLGVDAGGERRILVRRRPMWCCEFPSLLEVVLSRSRRQPAIHSSISAHDGVRPRPDGLNQKRRPHRSRWATALRRARVGPWPRLKRRPRGIGLLRRAGHRRRG